MSRKGWSRFYGLPERPLPQKCREYVDMDYAHKLSQEDKLWLAEFSRRYYLDSREPCQHMTPEQAALVKAHSGRENHARRRDLSNFTNFKSFEEQQERLLAMEEGNDEV